MYFFQDVKWEGVCGGWGVWDDWEGDGRGGGFTEMKVFALLSLLCLYVNIFFFFDKNGRLPIKKMNLKNTRLSKKTPITHKEFNQKIPTF